MSILSVVLALFGLGVLPCGVGCVALSVCRIKGNALPVCTLVGLLCLGLILPVLIAAGMSISAAILLSSCVGFIGVVHGIRSYPSLFSHDMSTIALWALLASALLTGLAFQVVLNPVNDWDGLYMWYAKASGLFHGIAPQQLPAAEYPNLGPALWAWSLWWCGASHEMVGRWLMGCLFVLALFPVMQASVSWWGRLLAPLSLLAFLYNQQTVSSGYQEGVLLAVICLALASFFKSFEAQTRGEQEAAFRLGLLACASLAWVKNEGLVTGFIIAFSATLLHLKDVRGVATSRVARELILFLVILFGWPMMRIVQGGNPAELQGSNFSLSSVLEFESRLARWYDIQSYVNSYIDQTLWKLSLGISGLALLFTLGYRKISILLFLSWTANIVFVYLAFFLTSAPLDWHLATAFGRLAHQTAVYPALATAFAVNAGLIVLRGARVHLQSESTESERRAA